jgi:hypothetical protein
MDIETIKNMNKDELIEFAKEFNIHKNYTFIEYTSVRDTILNQLQIYNIDVNELQHVRSCSTDKVQTYINRR